jgi:hypothetical protein
MLINIGTIGPNKPPDPSECEVDCTLLSGQAQVPLYGTRKSRLDCTLQIILQLKVVGEKLFPVPFCPPLIPHATSMGSKPRLREPRYCVYNEPFNVVRLKPVSINDNIHALKQMLSSAPLYTALFTIFLLHVSVVNHRQAVH